MASAYNANNTSSAHPWPSSWLYTCCICRWQPYPAFAAGILSASLCMVQLLRRRKCV